MTIQTKGVARVGSTGFAYANFCCAHCNGKRDSTGQSAAAIQKP